MTKQPSLPDAETQRLLQFLYMCPTGLISFDSNGTVELVNPAAVNLLVSTADLGTPENVFDMFDGVWPALRPTVARHGGRAGRMIDDHRIQAIVGDREQWLSLALVCVAPTNYMLTVVDVSLPVAAEQQVAGALDTERLSRERLEFLERTASRIAAASSTAEVCHSVLMDIKEALGLEMAAVNLRDGDSLRLVALPTIDASIIDRYQGADLTVPLPGPEAMTQNEAIVVRGLDEIRARYPEIATDGYVLEGLAAVPLRSSSGASLGALVVGTPDAATLDHAMVSVLQSVAYQAGQALERAALFERLVELSNREHTIAIRLQRALLPEQLVQHPNLLLTARYTAAADLMEVGGDWYDTFAWASHVGLVVGDVVGHDIVAATTMGRLRSGVAALAPLLEPRPAALLDAHAHCAQNDTEVFATVASVVINTETGELAYALAGHPPPLLLQPDGTTSWLWGRPSPPIGTGSGRGHHEERLRLQPGCCLIVYSDGLVERRGENLTVGLERLASTALAHRETAPEELADVLVSTLAADGMLSDDVVVICARWQPPPHDRFAEELPAQPESVAVPRGRLHRWLTSDHPPGADQVELVPSPRPPIEAHR